MEEEETLKSGAIRLALPPGAPSGRIVRISIVHSKRRMPWTWLALGMVADEARGLAPMAVWAALAMGAALALANLVVGFALAVLVGR